MYYGNAAATTMSSGPSTFIYYDDGSTTTGWTTAGTVGSSNVQGNPVNSLRANGAVRQLFKQEYRYWPEYIYIF